MNELIILIMFCFVFLTAMGVKCYVDYSAYRKKGGKRNFWTWFDLEA